MRVIFIFLLTIISAFGSHDDERNRGQRGPLYQHLPNCDAGNFRRIKKETKMKAMACPMVRDEEGFLSEWVAYYQMHGFDHITFFNDGSVDKSFVELQPWIDSGFVTIRSNFTQESFNVHFQIRDQAFQTSMAIKALSETECKLEAIRLGYDYYFSLDLDEYVLPHVPGSTIIDTLDRWVKSTGRPSYCMKKLNFQSAPHTLEPINLLTIEAYQTRVRMHSQLNYYISVAPKCAYSLHSSEFTKNTSEFIAKCCHFHGCEDENLIEGSTFCTDNYVGEKRIVTGKGKGWYDALYMNHYSRSLEKFALKQKTWKTATNEVLPGQTASEAQASYSIPKFFARSVGWYHDNTALRYSCQLRETLKNMTGDDVYLRPGSFWYRNPEFGRTVTDPEKRGAYGIANPPGFKFIEANTYNYHGGRQGAKSVDISASEIRHLKYRLSHTDEDSGSEANSKSNNGQHLDGQLSSHGEIETPKRSVKKRRGKKQVM